MTDPLVKFIESGGTLPAKPNWLEEGLLVRVLDTGMFAPKRREALLSRRVNLDPELTPKAGDIYKVLRISEHPRFSGWYGVWLEGFKDIWDEQQVAALYDVNVLPDIRPNFEPVDQN